MEKTKSDTVPEFDVFSIVPVNSCMSDFRQMFLKKHSKFLLDSSPDIHRELIRKYKLCNSLLNMYCKREILTKLSRVRYKPSNDLWEVQVKENETKLSSRMKTFLQVISERGFEFLQKEGLFQDFVEIDSSSETFVLYKDKLVKLCLDFDVLCPENQVPVCQLNEGLPEITSNEKLKLSTAAASNHADNCSENKILPRKGILKRSKHFEYPDPSALKGSQNIVELNDTDSEDDSTNQKTESEAKETYDTLILSFVLSLRKSIPAQIVLKHFFSQIISTKSKNMIAVFHVGPLIKDEEIVLYQYISDKDLRLNPKSLQTTDIDNTPNHGHLNLDPYLASWFNNENKLVHQFSDCTESIQNSIYEYQGLEKLQTTKVRKSKSKK